MYWNRLIVSAGIVTLAFLVTNVCTFAQGQFPTRPTFDNDPFDDPNWPGLNDPNLPQPSADGVSTARAQIERARREAEAETQAPQLGIEANQRATPGAGANTVSVAQLRHPLSRKGMRLIEKVQSYLKIGQRAKAKEKLAEALKEPSAAPYAHAILGTEYLRDGQPDAAVRELQHAAQVLPISGVHSNLGYALCLTGQINRGRAELEEALRLNGSSPQARFLMGVVLLNQKAQPKDAEYNLKMAEDRVHSAHLALAVCHLLAGENDAAEEEVHEFLGPDRQTYFQLVWQWASAAAAFQHPAAAFGFRDNSSD